MAIKKESIIAMATALKMDMTVINAALASTTEDEVKLPDGISVFTAAELTGREETLRNAGIKAGKEIAVKELKELTGLEYDGEGSKDPKRFVTEHGKKVLSEANIVESEKIKAKDTVIEGLRTNIVTLTTEKETSVKATKAAQLDSDLLSWTIDKKPDNLTNQEWLAIIKLNNEIIEQDGAMVVRRDGKIVSTTTDLKPIPPKDAVNAFIDERKIGKVPTVTPANGGRGGPDSNSPAGGHLGITNMKQFNEHLKEKGINPTSQQAQTMMTEVTTANKDFDFNTK